MRAAHWGLMFFAIAASACTPAKTTAPPAAQTTPSPAPQGLPWQLGKNEVLSTMARYRGWAADCYVTYKVRGLVQLVLTILPSGEVESIHVEGELAGTPEGECFITVLRKIRFPPFAGPK